MAFTFTVEDGTSVEDANSYGTFAGFVDYWTGREAASADPGPASAEADVELWLVAATDYVTRAFTFRGRRADADQGLWFPVTGLYDSLGNAVEGVPDNAAEGMGLVSAVYEYAHRAGTAALMPDPSQNSLGQDISSASVGALSVAFRSGGGVALIRPYPTADFLLRNLVRSRGGVIH